MTNRGVFINDVWLPAYDVCFGYCNNAIKEAAKECFNGFINSFPSEEGKLQIVEIDLISKTYLYSRIYKAMKQILNRVKKYCGGHLHSRVKAFLRQEDGNLIFRCTGSGFGNPDDINSYMDDYVQLIEPIIFPAKIEHEYVSVVEIKDLSGKRSTYKNPDKINYLNDYNVIFIEDKGIEHAIRFAEAKRFTQNLYRIELNRE